MVMFAYKLISLVLTGLNQVSLPSEALPKYISVQPTAFISTKPAGFSPEGLEIIPSELKETLEACDRIPSGIGIPGFQPGINKSDVVRMLGTPTVTTVGYWQNTNAFSYELVPGEVSLGFLFDKKSGKLRQTEAAFAQKVDTQLLLVTVNGMLGCKLNEKIKIGLEKVRQKQTRNYQFILDSLKGVIERDKSDRIYVGIWEADLH